MIVVIVVRDRDPGDEGEDFARAGAVAHRMRRLMKLGYCEAEALVLAQNNVDPREVAGLVTRGCPLETAARILL